MSEYFVHRRNRFAFTDIGAGPPLVLLHGLGGNREGALELVDEQIRCRRLALDQRGHGETAPVGPEACFTFPALAEDLAAFLDALEIDRAVLAGVSMGSGVALRFALDNPSRVAGMALVRPAWLDTPMTPALLPYVEIARLLRALPVEDALAEFKRSSTYVVAREVSSHAAASMASQFTAPDARERAARLDRMPRSTPYSDSAELAGIAAPTKVIGCDRDPLHPIDFALVLGDLIPDASLEIVPSAADGLAAHRRVVGSAVASFVAGLSNGYVDNGSQ